ncbi:lipase maturation factor family protein [Occallatibacter riparius]|uniref:Lipase maturation factor family protein n=1 Tax=Occallatibacter riparius TaxID=1002689 RepID=A0A9J7BQT5_9BACT|nr:lipase maturation factor family protein [Occallatibacter riparius]UWZ84098.1 lipase maturation factor family protein [Occallatibacter riparius]
MTMEKAISTLRRWFDPQMGARNGFAARWIWVRALALIYFSAFFSLLFQIKGLIGPEGIEPAGVYLRAIAQYYGRTAWWHAPTLFWFSSSSAAVMTVTWLGIAASLLAFCNVWPRANLFVCWICFLSFVTSAGDFSSYQSDGMLLEAGFISLFFAPPGLWPGLAAERPSSQISLWLLRWEWFRIYFESGIVKELSGDPQWRNFTAMDEYYQNSPLPTWIGWYVQHLPHWFHAASVVGTLLLEFVLVWMLFFPRRVRLICFLIVTPWEIGVILTGNYAFLNYIVLALGFLLLDDVYLRRVLPVRFRDLWWRESSPAQADLRRGTRVRQGLHAAGVVLSGVVLLWIGYATTAEMLGMIGVSVLPMKPVTLLEPFRIANQYGLFAVMTRGRYEIEFQGSEDGENWQPYLFTHKPQLLNEAPRIYAPYQPRFDWNLWFASLGNWQQNEFVPSTEEKLLMNDRDVVGLFRSDPFNGKAPRFVRAVLWQYWFTSIEEKRKTGNWWRRTMLGLYAPAIERTPDGQFEISAPPDALPRHD